MQLLFLSELKKRAKLSCFQPIYPDRKEVKFGHFRRANLNAGVSKGAQEASEQDKIPSEAQKRGHRCLFKFSTHATVTWAQNKARLLSNNLVSELVMVWGK